MIAADDGMHSSVTSIFEMLNVQFELMQMHDLVLKMNEKLKEVRNDEVLITKFEHSISQAAMT